jgi:hypothetical protein
MENLDKKRINVYLDTRIIQMAHLDTNNLSQLVNDLLSTYLSASSVEEVQKEISEHEKKIKALIARQNDLLKQGASETQTSGMKKKFEDDLKKIYKKRREEIGDNQDLDFDWLNSPKNIQRCRLLGKEPLQICNELREWFQKNNGGRHK